MKGAQYIMEALNNLFASILKPEDTSPQTPAEYIQEELVPEAGLRLVRENLRRLGETGDLMEKAEKSSRKAANMVV